MTTLDRKMLDPRDCSVMRVMRDVYDPEAFANAPVAIPATEKTYEVKRMPIPRFSEKQYLQRIQEFERKFENRLIKLFSEVDISASVKTDPYSLPHKEEIVVTLNGSSDLNGPWRFERVAREILWQVLEKGHYKLRFYLFVNCVPGSGFLKKLGAVEYRFRYYPQ